MLDYVRSSDACTQARAQARAHRDTHKTSSPPPHSLQFSIWGATQRRFNKNIIAMSSQKNPRCFVSTLVSHNGAPHLKAPGVFIRSIFYVFTMQFQIPYYHIITQGQWGMSTQYLHLKNQKKGGLICGVRYQDRLRQMNKKPVAGRVFIDVIPKSRKTYFLPKKERRRCLYPAHFFDLERSKILNFRIWAPAPLCATLGYERNFMCGSCRSDEKFNKSYKNIRKNMLRGFYKQKSCEIADKKVGIEIMARDRGKFEITGIWPRVVK